MGNKHRYSVAVWLLAALAAVVCGLLWRGKESTGDENGLCEELTVEETSERADRTADGPRPSAEKAGDEEVTEADEGEEPQSAEEPQTEEERREAAENALVDAFDDLTDQWTEPTGKGVSMADVDKFAATFKKLPPERRDECLHRALNLVPDENVMLLAGILMDKTLGQETVETVFNDILNRDEDVKKPVLLEIFKDREHPCWADTAWILDATGETPEPVEK